MEYRKICNICGKIWCYTDEDIKQNFENAGLSALSSIGAIASTLAGSRYDAYEQTKRADRAGNKIRDFDKCPDCGSMDVRDISDEEFSKIQKNGRLTKIVSINSNASVDNILKRIELFIEDEEWDTAEFYCEQALDLDVDNGYLWLLKLLIGYKWKIVDGTLMVNGARPPKIEESEYYERVMKFVEKDADLKKKLDKIKNDLNEYLYNLAVEDYNLINSEVGWYFCEAHEDVEQKFLEIKDYKDSARYIKLCQDKKREIKEHDIYVGAIKKIESDRIDDIKEAKEIFKKNSHWKDAERKIVECDEKLELLKFRKQKKTTQKKIVIASFVILLVVVSVFLMINH